MIKICEMPDTSTNSAYKDTANFIVNSAILDLMNNGIIDLEDWDVKGTKFTIRFSNKPQMGIQKKTVIVLLPSKLDTDIKFINDQTKNKDKYTLTYNISLDIQEVVNRILNV